MTKIKILICSLFIGLFVCLFNFSSFAYTIEENGNIKSDNLVQLADTTYNYHGVDIVVENGVLTVKGTFFNDTAEPNRFTFPLAVSIPSGTYSSCSKVSPFYLSSLDTKVPFIGLSYVADSIRGLNFNGGIFSTSDFLTTFWINFVNNSTYDFVFKPMLVEGNVSPTTFEPYYYYYSEQSYDNLQGRYDVLKDAQEQAEIMIDQLQSQYKQLQADYENLQSQYNQLQVDNDFLRSQLESLISNNENLQSQYNLLQADYESLQSDYDALSSNYDTLDSQLQQKQADYDKLSQNYVLLQNNYDALVRQLNIYNEYVIYGWGTFIDNLWVYDTSSDVGTKLTKQDLIDNGYLKDNTLYVPKLLSDIINDVNHSYRLSFTFNSEFNSSYWFLTAVAKTGLNLSCTLVADGGKEFAFNISYYPNNVQLGSNYDDIKNVMPNTNINLLTIRGDNISNSTDLSLGNNDTISFESGYSNGYQEGYNKGNEEGNKLGYDKGKQDGYSLGYDKGLADGDTSPFLTLFNAVLNAPINIFRNVFNFDLFGVNIYGLCTSLLTFALIIWLIKRFL